VFEKLNRKLDEPRTAAGQSPVYYSKNPIHNRMLLPAFDTLLEKGLVYFTANQIINFAGILFYQEPLLNNQPCDQLLDKMDLRQG
jgi:hypothetical protein